MCEGSIFLILSFSELKVNFPNVSLWSCFKWVSFLLQTCSHTYDMFSFLLGNYFVQCFYVSVYPLLQLCKNVTFWFDVSKKLSQFYQRRVLPYLAVSKAYILLLALFGCLVQSCKCPKSLKQCLGCLFELITVHGLLLLGSIVHQECFLVSSPF